MSHVLFSVHSCKIQSFHFPTARDSDQVNIRISNVKLSILMTFIQMQSQQKGIFPCNKLLEIHTLVYQEFELNQHTDFNLSTASAKQLDFLTHVEHSHYDKGLQASNISCTKRLETPFLYQPSKIVHILYVMLHIVSKSLFSALRTFQGHQSNQGRFCVCSQDP